MELSKRKHHAAEITIRVKTWGNMSVGSMADTVVDLVREYVGGEPFAEEGPNGVKLCNIISALEVMSQEVVLTKEEKEKYGIKGE